MLRNFGKKQNAVNGTAIGVVLLMTSYGFAAYKQNDDPPRDLGTRVSELERTQKQFQMIYDKKLQDVGQNVMNLTMDIEKTNGVLGGYLPVGSIVAYHGDPTSLPSYWRVCDGNNGTPNLQQKFLRGAESGANGAPLDSFGGKDTVDDYIVDVNGEVKDVSFPSNSVSPAGLWFQDLIKDWTFTGYSAGENFRLNMHTDRYALCIERPLSGNGPYQSHGHVGGTGKMQGTAKIRGFDNRPAYVSVYFIMKVRQPDGLTSAP
jgi:hypothetical protein